MWVSATGRGLLDSHRPTGLPAGQTFSSTLSIAGHRNLKFLIPKSKSIVGSGLYHTLLSYQHFGFRTMLPQKGPFMSWHDRPSRIEIDHRLIE